MKKAYINHISYYLPDNIVTNDHLSEEFPDWSVKKIANKIGIDQRHIAASDEFSSDMGVKAAEKLFDQYDQINKSEIDFLLFCTQSPDYFLPTTACILQDRIGLSKSIGALDFNLGCSGFIYGLTLAKGLIVSGAARNVLLICAETYSKFINKNDKGNRSIFGDAASATLVSDKNNGYGAEIMNFKLGTDGSGANNLIVKGGGMRYRHAEAESFKDNYGNFATSNDLIMNGPEIFNFTSKNIPNLVKETLKLNNLSQQDINSYVFHQANAYMLNHLRKKIKIDKEKFKLKMDFCGNTVSSTIQIALAELMKRAEIKNDDFVLIAGFGVGYSWGATILKF